MIQGTTIASGNGINPSDERSAHAERITKIVSTERAVISRETGINLFRDMTLGRRFEDKCAEMYYRGKMFGFVHLYNGQEAVSSGVICSMKKKHDWFCSTYRDHVHALSAGVPAKEVMSCDEGLFSVNITSGKAIKQAPVPVILCAHFTASTNPVGCS